MTNKIWGVAEAAEYLGVSRSWVYQEMEARHLPYRMLGRRIRFIPSELEAWMKAQPKKKPGGRQ